MTDRNVQYEALYEVEPAAVEEAPRPDGAAAAGRSIDNQPAYGRRGWLAPSVLLLTLLMIAAVLAAWKVESMAAADAAAASQPEPMEAVAVAVAEPRQHRRTVTAIGTVLATRSVTLRNELSGTVREVRLTPGQIVEAGTVLVRLDVSVEEAELAAQRAQAALAETILERNRQASRTRAVSEVEVDRARAERDVALANIARTEAVIARKTIRAPFRARVGMADVHPGQYLDEGTVLTTLQGVAEAAHVDFAVPQRVAAVLRPGDAVQVFATGEASPIAGNPIGGSPASGSTITGTIVAVDARVDPATRNAVVRARIDAAALGPAPGASVRVEIPAGPAQSVVAVPVSALRKGPAGDHVFVVARGEDGRARAQLRTVESGEALAKEVLILSGLAPGEEVAASGSFKLRQGALLAVPEPVVADSTLTDSAAVAAGGAE